MLASCCGRCGHDLEVLPTYVRATWLLCKRWHKTEKKSQPLHMQYRQCLSGAVKCWHRMTEPSWQTEKSRREAVCYQADIGTQPLSDNTENTFTSDKVPHPWSSSISSSPLPCLLWKQKVTSLDLLASVFYWVWKKFRFCNRKESPFVSTDKGWGMKWSLLLIWEQLQSAWGDFFPINVRGYLTHCSVSFGKYKFYSGTKFWTASFREQLAKYGSGCIHFS